VAKLATILMIFLHVFFVLKYIELHYCQHLRYGWTFEIKQMQSIHTHMQLKQ